MNKNVFTNATKKRNKYESLINLTLYVWFCICGNLCSYISLQAWQQNMKKPLTAYYCD